MEVVRKTEIKLSAKDVEEIVKDHLQMKGYDVDKLEFKIDKVVDNSDIDDRFHSEQHVFAGAQISADEKVE